MCGNIGGGFMRSVRILLSIALLATILAMKIHPLAWASDKITADTLRQMEGEFMKAAVEHGSAGYMSYYADDAVEVPNGAAIISGKVNIAKTMRFLDDKNNRLTWTPVGADVSASEDLGYTYGTYEFRALGKDGKPVAEHGKYTSIWKKQKDGSWKVVLDMGNTSGPTS
jgi:ketosteroid isomerase-like protein